MLILALLSTVLPLAAADRLITVTNLCPFTVWPGVYTNVGRPQSFGVTGWESPSWSTHDVWVPDGWAGRIWGRRECNFGTGSTDATTCNSGGCLGGLECDRSAGTGVPPATLAEFTLNDPDSNDYYDISAVDGLNLPMTLTNTGGGRTASCAQDSLPDCPEDYMRLKNPSGITLGCKTVCTASNNQNEAACCKGYFSTPQTCPTSGVPHYDYFKSKCSDGYAYAYDESSLRALFTVPWASYPSFTVTFCP